MKTLHARLAVVLGSAFGACAWTVHAQDCPCDVTEAAKLLAPDPASFDAFGTSGVVAISGDTAVIGAPGHDHCAADAGAAYVFRFDGLNWILEAELRASDCAAGEKFGSYTGIDGDIIVIGAFADVGPGAAYVFEKGAGWGDGSANEIAKLVASDGASGDNFGRAKVFGDTIVVGASRDDGDAGSAYVFEKPFDGWINMTETAKLIACDAQGDAFFGNSVSIWNDTVVIGAIVSDNVNGVDAGTAYSFEKGAGWVDGCTNQVCMLVASDGESSDQFGSQVSISGDTVVVGAYVDDGAAGSAYIFELGTGCNEVAKLTACDRAPNDFFGHGVSISGDVVMVGAFGENSRTGAAYVFEKPAGGWVDMQETVRLGASDGAANHEFGSVAISGDAAVVGASAFDNASGTDVGAAYVFWVGPAVCGNGLCEAGNGEDCASCPDDCNGKQNGKPSGRFCCGDGDGQNPLSCDDPVCSTDGWSFTAVPKAGSETTCCGDFVCEGDEDTCNCEIDCGVPDAGEIPGLTCSDGLDNDCDGLTDGADDDCPCAGNKAACSSGADCCSGNCKRGACKGN